MVTTEDITQKYSARLNASSQEYQQFKQDIVYKPSMYEKAAQSLGSLIKLRVNERDKIRIGKQLKEAHLHITPEQALSLAVISLLTIILLTVIISAGIFFITTSFPLLFTALGILIALSTFYYTYTLPERKASLWKLQASSQMVPAVLYTVVYMKHTSNIERAVEFTSQHLEGPLANEFKKIIYDVEIGKYSTIKQSLDIYLENWREYAPEFVESFHLIESSLYEPSEARRIQILEKALQVILDGVYEKMLKFSREIRSPLTNVYMLGIILPTLGLAMLPLASTLLQGLIQWYHVMILFNILIPFLVLYMTSTVLLKRPGGYGESSILEKNPEYPAYASNKPWKLYGLLCIPLILIGFLPFFLQTNLALSLGFKHDYTFEELGLPFFTEQKLFDFKIVNGSPIGPFSPFGVLMSMFIPFGLGLYFYLVYKRKTTKLMESREKTKQLENEFNNALFQLGNRLGDNIPAEIAFAKVAEVTQHQQTHDFFALVNTNIQQAGMSVDAALFDSRRGAIIYYPSALITTSMKILVEATKKGLQVAAQSLMAISEYVKNIQKINQRLRDLLAEIVSDMKSNMTFLAPLLAGIVVGLGVMITSILNKLDILKSGLNGQDTNLGLLGSLPNIFDVNLLIPPYFMQLSIGIYMLEIIFILTRALVTVDAGTDELREKSELASNIRSGLTLYLVTAFFSTLALTFLASIALTNI